MKPAIKSRPNAPFGKWVHWLLLGGPILCASIFVALEILDYAGKEITMLLVFMFIGITSMALVIYGVFLPLRSVLLRGRAKRSETGFNEDRHSTSDCDEPKRLL